MASGHSSEPKRMTTRPITLPLEFSSCGFDFQQVERDGDLAIYQKTRKSGKWTGFEVVRIRSHDGYTIAGNYCPPAEMYPSNEKWGVDGFSCSTIADARKRLANLRSEVLCDA